MFFILFDPQMITGLVIYPLVCFPGVLGNTLTLFVLSRRNMQTSTNAFLSALAVSDSVKLINDILYFFVIVFMKTSTTLGNLSYGYLYPYAHFIFSFSACVSSWLTVSMAVERYLMVCHPTRVRAVWSRRRAVLLCTLIYVIMSLLALPSALRYKTIACLDVVSNMTRLDVQLTEMWKNEIFVKIYTWAQNLLRSIIPLIVLVILNTCIITALRRSQTKKRKNARHRVTVMMIVVILAFLICITPDAIMSTVFGLGYHEADYLAKGIREITDALLAINAGINFLIYCAFNQIFRKSFLRLCCHKTKRSNTWMTELEESTFRRLSDVKTAMLSNNNSLPIQDTSPTLVTDNSLAGFTNKINGKHQTADSASIQLAQDTNDSSSANLNSSLSNGDSGSQTEEYANSSENDHQTFVQPLALIKRKPFSQHIHRISKDGLKHSRNSIKCTRDRHKAISLHELHQTCRETDKLDVHSDKLHQCLDTESNSVRSSFYQHQLFTKVCACVHDVPTTSKNVSDHRQSIILTNCQGEALTSQRHEIRNNSTHFRDFNITSHENLRKKVCFNHRLDNKTDIIYDTSDRKYNVFATCHREDNVFATCHREDNVFATCDREDNVFATSDREDNVFATCVKRSTECDTYGMYNACDQAAPLCDSCTLSTHLFPHNVASAISSDTRNFILQIDSQMLFPKQDILSTDL
ncbi:G-protein coupled receptor [Biomphalaria glabrata]